jgi:hypothetical protein
LYLFVVMYIKYAIWDIRFKHFNKIVNIIP